MNRVTITIMAFLSLVLAIPHIAPAQTEPAEQRTVPERFVYEWTDKNGVVHVTDDPSQVPKSYRGKSLKKRIEPRGEVVQEPPQSETVKPSSETTVPSDQEFEERLRRDEWQQRYLDWKDRLQRSEQRLQSLQQRRATLITPWGSPAVAPPAVREELVQVDQSLQDTQAEIDEARHMLEEVLPDEARKAGVPPGWTRE
jgi:hypothetical protein